MPDQAEQAQRLHEAALEVLGTFWNEPSLKTMITYSRQHDDNDGGLPGVISVFMGADSDLHVSIDTWKALRFRDPEWGGGRSPRVRNALMLLALAIKLDNEESLSVI